MAQLRAKISKADSNHVLLASMHESNKLRKELNKANCDLGGDDSPLSRLDDLDKAVKAEAAEADAYATLAGDANPAAALEAKYGDTGSANVDAEVAAMMAAANKPAQ